MRRRQRCHYLKRRRHERTNWHEEGEQSHLHSPWPSVYNAAWTRKGSKWRHRRPPDSPRQAPQMKQLARCIENEPQALPSSTRSSPSMSLDVKHNLDVQHNLAQDLFGEVVLSSILLVSAFASLSGRMYIHQRKSGSGFAKGVSCRTLLLQQAIFVSTCVMLMQPTYYARDQRHLVST